MNKKNRHTRKAHRPTYAEDWSDDDVLDHPAVAWKSLQVQLKLHCCHDFSNCVLFVIQYFAPSSALLYKVGMCRVG